MVIDNEIQRFKMELLRKMPFYGDILMHLVFVADKNVKTAATDGKTIWYNSDFLSALTPGQRNFVLMHEFFHVILRHGIRNMDSKRDRYTWNIACDIIINNMLTNLTKDMIMANIPFERPADGVFAYVSNNETAENLYAKIKADNSRRLNFNNKFKIRRRYIDNSAAKPDFIEIDVPLDILPMQISVEEMNINDQLLQKLIRSAAKKNRGEMGSHYVPQEIFSLTVSRRLDWRRLLKDFLSQELGDDSSYTTPERKYLHMDMILPGHSLTEESLSEVWAFIDSSGSIGHNEMEQFLTQVYRIAREFKCLVNICYWDTAVTDVYTKICREDDILKCLPHHSGGTDINCVYNWIKQNKVKPDVMLILTDGYFGRLTTNNFDPRLRKKTILVLSTDIMENADMSRIGKITRL